MNLLLRLVVMTLSVYVADYILSGVSIDDFFTAIVFAVVLAFLNVTLKPFLQIVTIPFTLFTFGLFLLVVNVLVIEFAAYLVNGVHVEGFWWALAFSLVVSAVNGFLTNLGKEPSPPQA
jgi:putative membrane protein